MAGDWIKMREDLYEDPVILGIAKRLETRPEHVVGYCHRFWGWASRNLVPDVSRFSGDKCPDSVPLNVPLMSLENVLTLPGFLTLLIEFGWLKYTESGELIIPKFDRHLSESAKRRALAAEKKRLQRENKTTKMSLNNWDKCPRKTGTREEKRREEINTSPNGEVSSEPPEATTEPSILIFPTVGKTKTWGLTQRTIDSLAQAFPRLIVIAECRKALAWCEANSAKRKTNKGMPAFLFRWMEKEQNIFNSKDTQQPLKKTRYYQPPPEDNSKPLEPTVLKKIVKQIKTNTIGKMPE